MPGNYDGARAALFEVCGDILPDQTWYRWVTAVRLHDQQLAKSYSELCQTESEIFAQVEKDIRRTFPEIDAFDDEQEQSLGRILNAFANHDPKVAYCQGMNYVAGVLLMLSNSEEEAFGVLVILMDRYGLDGFYSDGLPLLPRYVDAFSHLLREEAPALTKHFEQEGLTSCLYLHEWFLTLFINCLPLNAVIVVWTAMIHEGLEILIPIAVAILQAWEEEILEAKFADIFTLLKSLSSKLDQEDRLQPLMKKISSMKVPESVLEHLAASNSGVGPWLRSFQQRLKALSPRKRRSTQEPRPEVSNAGSALEKLKMLSPRKRRGPKEQSLQVQETSRESIVEHGAVRVPPAESASPGLLKKLASLSPRRRPKLKVVAGQESSKSVIVGVVPGGSHASWQPGTVDLLSPKEGGRYAAGASL